MVEFGDVDGKVFELTLDLAREEGEEAAFGMGVFGEQDVFSRGDRRQDVVVPDRKKVTR